MFWCSIPLQSTKMNLLEGAFVYPSNLAIWIRISFAWNIFPLQTSEAPWKEELYQMDANGFTQIEVTFQPKGPGLEVVVTNFLLILFSLVD